MNSELHNLQVSVNTAILVLGRDLTIRRFTPVAERVFNLLATDLGRPLGGVRHNLDFPDLEQFLAQVITCAVPAEREVRDHAGHWFSLRARPFVTLDNQIDGAVLMLVDIDALKQADEQLRLQLAVLQSTANAIVFTGRDGIIQWANPALTTLTGYSPEEVIGQDPRLFNSGKQDHAFY